VPDLPPGAAGEELPALVASLRVTNARLREVIEAKDAQLAAASAALEAAEARITGLAERVADLERRPSGTTLAAGGITGSTALWKIPNG
jgi:Tfp pilus assembly protein FimV